MDLTEEALFDMITQAYVKKSELLLTGSLAELPMKYYLKNHTDIDVMVVPSDIYAVEKFDSYEGGDKEQLLIEDMEHGYVRLVSRDGRIYNSRLGYEGRTRWRCWAIGQTVFYEDRQHTGIKSRSVEFSVETISRCRKFQSRSSYFDEMSNMAEGSERVDNTWTIKWLAFWKYDREIVSQGCHFVTKPDMDRQWRYSFSWAELTLILTWSSTQKYIYHILRLILKEVKSKFKEEIGGKAKNSVFCSYSLKTLMYWKCENEFSAFWLEEKFENAINSILEEFLGSLEQLKLQNYFIRNYNNWSKLPVGIDFEKEIEFLKFIQSDGFVKRLLENNEFEESVNILISSLDSKSLQMYFNLFGFISILNVTGLNEIFSFAHFSELSNLKCLCRGLILQNQLASSLSRTSAPPSIEKIEKSLNMAYHSTYRDYAYQPAFADFAQGRSFFEIVLAAFKYFATDDFVSRLNETPRN